MAAPTRFKPLFSVLIPTFNSENRLHCAYDAITKRLESEHIDFELLIIDDGWLTDFFARLYYRIMNNLSFLIYARFFAHSELFGFRIPRWTTLVTLGLCSMALCCFVWASWKMVGLRF